MIPFVTGCVTTGPVSNTCEQWSAIYISVEDDLTIDTLRQIYTHNETGAILCNWGKE